MSRPRDEWKHDVMTRYKSLSQFSKEDARVQYLRIIRSLPYGALPPVLAPACAYALLLCAASALPVGLSL